MNSEHLDTIDILKGLAISMVLVVHSANLFLLPGSLNYFLSYGQMGTQLFFILSAFTLSLSWDKCNKGKDALKNYYAKRIKRIAPPYWFMIVFYALLAFITNDLLHISIPLPINRNFWDILANIFLVHGLVPSANNLVVISGWYIGTITILYILFPLLFTLYQKQNEKRKKTLNPITIITLLVVLAIRTVLEITNNYTYYSGNNSFIYFSFLNQLPIFCLGIQLYFDYQNDAIKWPTALGLFLVCTAISLFLFQYNTAIVFTLIPFITGCSFYGLFYLLNSYSLKKDNKATGVLRSLGKQSYYLYLVQPLTIFWMEAEVIKLIPGGLHSFSLYLILLIPTFTITYILGKIVEKVVGIIFRLS